MFATLHIDGEWAGEQNYTIPMVEIVDKYRGHGYTLLEMSLPNSYAFLQKECDEEIWTIELSY